MNTLRSLAPLLVSGLLVGACTTHRADTPETELEEGGEALACGAGRTLCALSAACRTNADCASAVCQTQGAFRNRCVPAKSCTGAPGADNKCGAGRNEWCCAAAAVPGGAFKRQYELTGGGISDSPATVSAFKLDTFEVTVGRLRSYMQAVGWNPRGNAPAAGAGAHPRIAGSGWRSSFTSRLAGSKAEVESRLTESCVGGGGIGSGVVDYSWWGAPTWILANGAGGAANPASNPESSENKPVGCIDWYTLAAFCAWDGGRLPTDAEWTFAAMGGSQQRAYAWTSAYVTGSTPNTSLETDISGPSDPNFRRLFGAGGKPYVVTGLRVVGDGADAYPIYTFPIGSPYWNQQGPRAIAPVGTSLDRGRYGHADLAGNLIEWTMDATAGGSNIGAPCTDCANVDYPDPPSQPGAMPRDWRTASMVNADGTLRNEDDEWTDALAVADGKRIARGSSWQGTYGGHNLRNTSRFWGPVWRNYSAIGGRCAR